jgi:excisionase family DNA binding protein
MATQLFPPDLGITIGRTTHTVEDVAKILRVHANTVYKRIKDGSLPAFRVGHQFRILETELRKFCGAV